MLFSELFEVHHAYDEFDYNSRFQPLKAATRCGCFTDFTKCLTP